MLNDLTPLRRLKRGCSINSSRMGIGEAPRDRHARLLRPQHRVAGLHELRQIRRRAGLAAR